MRLAIVTACVMLAPGLTCADMRPASRSLTCDRARALVEKQGAVIFTTGPTTFDRFVASRAFCTVSEQLEPAFAPASDDPQCFVGYRCREIVEQDRK
jgi:hypothetical protein